jgi:choline dehydrogenase
VLLVPNGKTEHDYLSELDVKKLAWGVAQVRDILTSPPLSLNLSKAEVSPGVGHSSDELKAWIRQSVYIYSHWVGTARMGSNPSHTTSTTTSTTSTSSTTSDSTSDSTSSTTSTGDKTAEQAYDDTQSIETSVVDPKLRVRGTDNLFVADASIMPKIPNGNVHSTVTMVAYCAADLITGKNEKKH